MTTSVESENVTNVFDIKSKLKSTGACWSYIRFVQPHTKDFQYEFNTILVDEMEFAIYEKCGDYFVLVDFFKSYDEACPKAKQILDDHPDVKKLFSNRAVN